MIVNNKIFKLRNPLIKHSVLGWLKIYKKPWKPTPGLRKDHRNTGPILEVKTGSVIDENWLNQFIGKISFWSFSIIKVRPDSKATKFRVFTHQRINFKRIRFLIEGAFPGCQVIAGWGYKHRHTFDVRVTQPITWREFIWKTVNALGRYL